MKKLKIIFFLLQVSNFTFASGCLDENYLHNQVALEIEPIYLKDSKIQVMDGGVLFSDEDGLESPLHYLFKNNSSLTIEELIDIKNATSSNSYKVILLSNEDILFSYENDREGITQGSTGRYKLRLSTVRQSYHFEYPTISNVLQWRFGSDKFLPPFKLIGSSRSKS